MSQNWIVGFSIKFYGAFILLSLLGNFIIHYNSLHIYTILCISIYVYTFVLGTTLGSSTPAVKLSNIRVSPYRLIKWLLIISVIAVVLGWLALIRYYGSLTEIFLHAFDVRTETIGDGVQLVPTYITYPGSLVYAAFAIAAVSFHYYKDKSFIKKALILGVVIVLTDLQAFGRIGILFAIFIIGGYVLLFLKNFNFRKLILPTSLLLVILMLPRWIRGGSSFEGIGDRYTQYTTFPIPEFFAPFLSIYAYYFSGIYALNEILIQDCSDFAFGQRNFASILNFLNRVFTDGDISHRLVIIGDLVYVPFDTNIFTIIGEIYMDFGLLGLVLLPLFFGYCIGYLFKYSGLYADALKLVLIAWIFYTPIYNAFSFGGFLISFAFLVFLTIFAESDVDFEEEMI